MEQGELFFEKCLTVFSGGHILDTSTTTTNNQSINQRHDRKKVSETMKTIEKLSKQNVARHELAILNILLEDAMTETGTRLKDRIKAAQKKVTATRALCETVDRINEETKREVLSDGDFREEETGTRITKTTADFLMDAASFETYCKQVYAANLSKGLDSGDWETNFYSYREAVINAENELIDLIPACIPQVDAETHKRMREYPHREKALALIMRVDTKTMPDNL